LFRSAVMSANLEAGYAAQGGRLPSPWDEDESLREVSVRYGGFPFDRIFPSFTWRSVIGVTVAVQLVVYVVSCAVVTPRGWVAPSNLANWKLGSSDSTQEACASEFPFSYGYELRRMFVPIFLHGNILHIALNLYFELSAGPDMEAQFGPLRFALLFFASGVSGNLLSDAFATNGVGASTACYGIIAVSFASLAVQWGGLSSEQKQAAKQGVMQSVGFLLFWEVMNWNVIDHYGHGGGFLGGFLLAVALDKQHAKPTWRLASAVLFGFMALLCALKIFVFHPEANWQVLCAQRAAWYSAQQ